MSSRTEARLRSPLYPGASLLGDAEAEAVARVMESRNLFRYYGFTQPNEVEAYEQAWAEHAGVRHALALNSGTSALFCSLVAAGVRPGDEVIIPAFGWISVPNTVVQVGAIPVVVDVDESLTIDIREVEQALGERTAAILAVHMRGAPCAMRELVALADSAGIPLIEDACQAAGATYDGRPIGSFGRVAAFSTQFAKLISTGEGGVMVTDDLVCYEAALDAHDPANALRRGAELTDYPGMNLRCTEIEAAIGRVQLGRLSEALELLRAHARRIAETVAGVGGFALRRRNDPVGDTGVSVIFFAPSAAMARETRERLRAAGIGATCLYEHGVPDLHVAAYWKPAHAALSALGRTPPTCDTSYDLLGRAVQIDVHPLFGHDDVDTICAAVEEAGRLL